MAVSTIITEHAAEVRYISGEPKVCNPKYRKITKTRRMSLDPECRCS